MARLLSNKSRVSFCLDMEHMMTTTKLKRGDKVYLMAYERDAKVYDALSSQFTVRYNKRVLFFFYADKGVTWNVHST